jgi:hypothetical protein
MAENLGGLSDRFATMSEEERRRYAQTPDASADRPEQQEELEFDDPRNDPGRTKANLEDRDGAAALLDEQQHDERVREQGAGDRGRQGA